MFFMLNLLRWDVSVMHEICKNVANSAGSLAKCLVKYMPYALATAWPFVYVNRMGL